MINGSIGSHKGASFFTTRVLTLITRYLNAEYVHLTLTLKHGQNGLHFADDIFKVIVLNENCSILIKFSLKFSPNGPIDNKSTLAQITS